MFIQEPLVPDPNTAQSQVLEELARPEYNQPGNPLTRLIYSVLERIASLFNAGDGDFPVATVVLIAFALVMVTMVVVVFLNPIRIRQRRSVSVLDGVDITLSDSRSRARSAAANAQWNEAVIWAYRTLALVLDQHRILVLSPGLTAQEVARQAAQAYPSHHEAFSIAARIFDDVRYGDITPTQEHYTHIDALISFCDKAGTP